MNLKAIMGTITPKKEEDNTKITKLG